MGWERSEFSRSSSRQAVKSQAGRLGGADGVAGDPQLTGGRVSQFGGVVFAGALVKSIVTGTEAGDIERAELLERESSVSLRAAMQEAVLAFAGAGIGEKKMDALEHSAASRN
jgi:hypothetical protein